MSAMQTPIEPQKPIPLQVEVLTTLEQFQALEPEWSDLMQRANTPHIFVDHAWLLTWLTYFPPRHLHMVLLKDSNGQLRAAFPLKIDLGKRGLLRRALRHLQWIGTDPDVYDVMPFLLDTQLNMTDVLPYLSQYLKQIATQWDVLDLRCILQPEALAQLAEHVLPSRGKKQYNITSPYSLHNVVLPKTIDAFEGRTKSPRFKRKLNNIYHRIHRLFPQQTIEVCFSDLPEHYDTMIQLHRRYWRERSTGSDFERYPPLRDYYQALLGRYSHSSSATHQILLCVLKVGDTIFHYQLVLVDPYMALGYIGAYVAEFDYLSPGIVSYEQTIRAIMSHFKLPVFSLGKGDEPYKRHWENEVLPLYNLFAPRHSGAKLFLFVDALLFRIKSMMNRKERASA